VIERFGFAHGPTRLTQSWPHPTSVIATPRRPGNDVPWRFDSNGEWPT
jgi:hypothetical protein